MSTRDGTKKPAKSVGVLPGSIPGYSLQELSALIETDETPDWPAEKWQEEFDETRQWLERFISSRDPYVVLSRTAARLAVEKPDHTRNYKFLEQAHVELTQAFVLFCTSTRDIPTSPGHFVKYWEILDRHLTSFIRKQPRKIDQTDFEHLVSRRARLQTLYYRNLFTREDCERTLLGILNKFDDSAIPALGYKLSDLFRAMIRILDIVFARLEKFAGSTLSLLKSATRDGVIDSLRFFLDAYPLARKAWRSRDGKFQELEQLRSAAFQVSEIAFPWVFSISREALEYEFSTAIVNELFKRSLRAGELATSNPEHMYLANPVWTRPYVRGRDGSLFAALPQAILSFPFAIIEDLMSGHSVVESAYEDARAAYLEEAIYQLLLEGIPSAAIYKGVTWIDPIDSKEWENDVVVFVGNFVFVFEAKSGRISDVARRGGGLSLLRNFRELYVSPGMQAWRLQHYLDTQRSKCCLRTKIDGKQIDVDFTHPKVVFRFSVCIEHFAALTSAKHYLKQVGAIADDIAWAPVLSLGELQMIHRFLDCELSFIHYLSRRATLEELVDFEGDEQDILSTYLTNGLCLDQEAVENRRLIFLNADGPIRQQKIPDSQRKNVRLLGVQVTAFWRTIIKELYLDNDNRHRFDIINVILNQRPPVLEDFERRIRRFKRGESVVGKEVLMTQFRLGKRVFVLAIHLAKQFPREEEWLNVGRSIASMLMPDDGLAECATFLVVRRSKDPVCDGYGFLRCGAAPRPSSGENAMLGR